MLGRYKRKFSVEVAKSRKKAFELFYNSSFFDKTVPETVFTVVSMSGSKYLLDQLYSICSFFANAGTPQKWIVFSDGSYTEEETALLSRIPFVEVRDIDTDKYDIDKAYFNRYPLLKKLAAYEQLPVNSTTILTDSDILFFPAFKNYEKVICSHNWYLSDEDRFYFDDDYLAEGNADMYGTNSGFIILNSKPDWSTATKYIFNKLKNKNPFGHWSEQTAIHLMIRQEQDFFPLDPRKFILSGKDSFKISVEPSWREIAIRHFVGPVRHKMWQTNWEEVLGLKK